MTPNLKLILGLVWTLILHYQIALGLAGEEVVTAGNATTPKQALLTFVNVSCTIDTRVSTVVLMMEVIVNVMASNFRKTLLLS